MENENCLHFSKRIDGTEYKVRVHFSEDTGDTFEDKLLRLISNRLLGPDDFDKAGLAVV